MKKIIIIFFLLSGCSPNYTENNSNLSNMNFTDSLSFEEFKIKLKEYANNSPYPDIN